MYQMKRVVHNLIKQKQKTYMVYTYHTDAYTLVLHDIFIKISYADSPSIIYLFKRWY